MRNRYIKTKQKDKRRRLAIAAAWIVEILCILAMPLCPVLNAWGKLPLSTAWTVFLIAAVILCAASHFRRAMEAYRP